VKYRTIVADPPWAYDGGFPSHIGGRVSLGKGGTTSKPLPYGSMSLEHIKALDVRGMADPHGAFLWLWTTNRYLRAGFDVLEAWGFDYIQTFVWVKDRRNPFAASLAPNHAEFALVGRRGGAKRIGTAASNVLDVAVNPNKVAHSTKPDAFLDLVETVSPGPYLEMFARRARFGWDYWGNESLQTAEVA
jgi:N6-adenosine-specific RNA methylase IME4